MKLESSYIRTTALGCVTMPQLGAVPEDYKWKDGICYNVKTGVRYQGDQKLSNCQTLYGSPPSAGKAGVFDFLKKTFLGGGAQQGPMPQASVTGSSLLMPAVVVVGGVALFLILRKKK